MPPHTDDLRIRSFAPLSTPAELLRELPCTEPMSDNVANARRALHRILHGEDDRLAVVIGPCSIHDPAAALEYAHLLRPLRDTHRRRARDRHARVFRETAHDRRLEGAHQRPRFGRQLQHQQGAAGSDGACSATSTTSACRPASSISTRFRRSTSRISSRGARSAPARPRARFIASWRRACRAPSGSRTAPTATSRSPWMPSAPRRTRIISWP